MDIQTDDWLVFEATTKGVSETKGNIHHRISSDASIASTNAPLREKQARAARSKFKNDGIEEKQILPTIAFEVFAGKSFTSHGDTSSTDLSDSVAKFKRKVIPSRGKKNHESPLERYHRLKAEVEELAQDVQTMEEEEEKQLKESASGSGSGSVQGGNSDGVESRESGNVVRMAPWSEMATGLLDMKSQLNAIAETSIMKQAGLSLPSNYKVQSVLTSKLLSEVEQMKAENNQRSPSTTSTSTTNTATATASSSLSENENGGASYEIYLNPTATLNQTVNESRLASIEARFHKVEKALGNQINSNSIGSNSSSGGNDGGLIGLVRDLEEKVSLMNPSNLDSVGRRVSALSSELEKIMKMKNRIARSNNDESGASSSSSSEREQQVNELFSLVESLGALDKELPLVVERLETLQSLHSETSSFSSR
jgi:hypothetical protein